MKFFVFLLSNCVLICYANAQYQSYYDDNVYNYPIIPAADGRTPNLGYDDRLLLRTTTTTATTTTTTTCTVSTNFPCKGAARRRRFLEDDDEEMKPTPVKKVEATPVADIESARNERKAEPQFPLWRKGDGPLYELRSTLGQGEAPLPVYYNYNPYIRQPVIVADTRLLFNYYAFTTTTTSTATVTSRSTPICSQGSGFNQC